MKQWEYHVEHDTSVSSDQWANRLNELGSLGWELVSVTDYYLYFKREKQVVESTCVVRTWIGDKEIK